MISVIIPIYQVEKYLDECIESVVNQTITDLEVILVDDGSQDECPRMCDEWGEKDARIKVIHKVNGGLSAARNTGLDNVKGDYIAFVDSDDYLEKNCFEKLLKALENNPDCSIASCSHYTDTNGIIGPPIEKEWNFENVRFIEPEDYAERMLLRKSQHTVWGKLFKTDVLKNIRFRNGCNNEDILFALDFYPIIEKGKIRIVEIPDKLTYYRQREGSICHDRDNDFSVVEFINRFVVIRAVKGRKPRVYEEYRKDAILQLCYFIKTRLAAPGKHKLSFIFLFFKAWQFRDSYAKTILNRWEYAAYIHYKYFAPIIIMRAVFKRKYNTQYDNCS